MFRVGLSVFVQHSIYRAVTETKESVSLSKQLFEHIQYNFFRPLDEKILEIITE